MSKFKDIRNKNEETYHGDDFYIQYGEMYYNDDSIVEAEYQGREVKLGKPMRGDVKKFKVFVKNNKGNVVKVNFVIRTGLVAFSNSLAFVLINENDTILFTLIDCPYWTCF